MNEIESNKTMAELELEMIDSLTEGMDIKQMVEFRKLFELGENEVLGENEDD